MTTDHPKWRDDFPIRWDEDNYMTRRELAKFLTLGSGLLAGVSAIIAAVGLTRKIPAPPVRRIAAAGEIVSGRSLLFHYPTEEDPCILLRDASGRIEAFSQVCTHLSCAVVHRPGEDVLRCPCHNGVFSAADGRPLAGPPTRQLPRVVVEERGSELLAVGIEV